MNQVKLNAQGLCSSYAKPGTFHCCGSPWNMSLQCEQLSNLRNTNKHTNLLIHSLCPPPPTHTKLTSHQSNSPWVDFNSLCGGIWTGSLGALGNMLANIPAISFHVGHSKLYFNTAYCSLIASVSTPRKHITSHKAEKSDQPNSHQVAPH